MSKTRAESRSVDVAKSSIKRVRLSQGLTVRELASRLEVTPAAVSQMERSEERGAIRLDTLRTALAAMATLLVSDTRAVGSGADGSSEGATEPSPFSQREDRVSFELHRAIAKKLVDSPEAIRAVIPDNVRRIRENVRGPLVSGWLDEWLMLAEAPLGQLLGVLLATDEHGREMRQNGPFMGVLTQEERLAAIRRAAVR